MGGLFKTPGMPSAPGPSPEQLALIEEQRVQIAEQRALAAKMSNVQMRSLGFQEDPTTGEWIQAAPSEEQTRAGRIRELLQERQIAALEGREEVSPALERELAEERRLEEEAIRRGPGMDSTTGRQRLSQLDERQANIREASRRGDIVTMEQLLSGRTTQELQRSQYITSGVLATGQQAGEAYSRAVSGYNVLQQPYLIQQQTQGTLASQQYAAKIGQRQMYQRMAIGAVAGGTVGAFNPMAGILVGSNIAAGGGGPSVSYQVPQQTKKQSTAIVE